MLLIVSLAVVGFVIVALLSPAPVIRVPLTVVWGGYPAAWLSQERAAINRSITRLHVDLGHTTGEREQRRLRKQIHRQHRMRDQIDSHLLH